MKYFQVDASSMNFCGFDSTFVFKGENENEVENSSEYQDMIDYMDDYVGGHIDEDDIEEYGEEVGLLSIQINEITEQEFLDHGENQM